MCNVCTTVFGQLRLKIGFWVVLGVFPETEPISGFLGIEHSLGEPVGYRGE